MSDMGQEMKTWLKTECQGVGEKMLHALSDIESAYSASFDLGRTEKAYIAEQVIKTNLEIAIGIMTDIPIDLLTAEERREIFDLEWEIKEGLKGKILPINIQLKLADLTDLTKKYLLEKVVECQCGKPGEIKPIEPSILKDKWYNKGVEAGKTDIWMDIENTIKEMAERHPEIKEAADLIFEDVEQWKQTDHYRINYGRPMWDDVQDSEIYPEVEVLFWDGYVTGRKQIGKDIYDIASELVKGR